MYSSTKVKESIIAASLIVFCLLSLVLGLYLIKKNNSEDNPKSEILSQLRSDRVAVIGLEGMIMDSFKSRSPFSSSLNVAYVKDQLNKAIEDKKTKAVLLRMNSPGGTVAASQEIYQLVQKLKAVNKPVIVSMSDVCASGCYYIASAADHIVANPGTLTGSIGVISSSLNFKGLLDKLGIVDQTFKAGKYKDLGSPTRPLTLEEKTILDALLADSYDQFLDDVSAGRSIDRTELESIAEGLVYTGRQALAKSLVDELGTYADAQQATRDILTKQFAYDAEDIKFVETWKLNKLAGLEDMLDLNISSMLSNLNFQTLWMMR
ncbi:MAG: signal peptide peptidase SppA [Candidatus Melainabacteria bacterium]|jgi:protease IV|nr:signal peptide peptidase SppA [Candidatus Melainabacteria bacterium]